MKFYNREKELKQLKEIGEMSLHNAQMTVLMGRRRIGKTKLLFKATEGILMLYFFVARKSEPMLYTNLGGYWDRKGENEIDLIALDDFDKKAIVAEIKRNKENIKLDKLVQKATSIQKELRGYDIEYRALSMEDM
ncbi:ATP-binding protein [Parabacteroides sp. AM58-2XD]|uniref:DUF234 domain-containing protein n=1 Tax=Parabacteroides TaxID=375288 RepID=UPI000FE21205|nr:MULTISPECIES: DUF234 domain-containing protein [Parabacteroides]RGY92839.1 ATP-binding protein [Parabacteroides sp. AM58-2XD]GKG75124.1 hypothetical protein CE91St1_42670 [Parabacteroides goldsteinii]GKG81469.1 hypothetical protein CE91St2_46610 [Parabacteroides goldsteinii]